MKGFFKKIAICVCAGLLLGGCATTKGGSAAKAADDSARKFKALSDEEALKTVVAVYNVKPESEEDIKAKNIALDVYMAGLKKRNSKYIGDSGVFQLSYASENLKNWSDREIVEMYRALEEKAAVYGKVEAGKLDEEEKTLMFMRMTAMDAVYKEGRKRDIFRNAVDIAMNALMIAASIAAAAI